MTIELGTTDINKIMVGTTQINRAYVGTVLSFGAAPISGGGGFYSYTRSASVFDDNASGVAQITATFNTDGSVSLSSSSGDTTGLSGDLTHWHDGGTVAGIGNSRWAKKTSTGDATTGTLTSTLVALSSARTISIQTVAGEARTGAELIEIYSDSGGTTKVGEINLTIDASP